MVPEVPEPVEPDPAAVCAAAKENGSDTQADVGTNIAVETEYIANRDVRAVEDSEDIYDDGVRFDFSDGSDVSIPLLPPLTNEPDRQPSPSVPHASQVVPPMDMAHIETNVAGVTEYDSRLKAAVSMSSPPPDMNDSAARTEWSLRKTDMHTSGEYAVQENERVACRISDDQNLLAAQLIAANPDQAPRPLGASASAGPAPVVSRSAAVTPPVTDVERPVPHFVWTHDEDGRREILVPADGQ